MQPGRQNLPALFRETTMATRLSAAACALRMQEKIMEGILFLCAASSVFITLSIVGVLLFESLAFFQNVPLVTFLTDTVWTPLANPRYGILPLLNGTLLSTLVAICVAGPLGLSAAVYLSEFASPRTRKWSSPPSSSSAACPRSCTASSPCCSSRPCCRRSSPVCPGSTSSAPGS